jgi:hypothetical protein
MTNIISGAKTPKQKLKERFNMNNKVFKYLILKNERQMLRNFINAESEEKARTMLEKEHPECDEIRLTEVFPNTY